MSTIAEPPPPAGAPPPSAPATARASALNLVARLASGAAAFGVAVLTTNVLSTHDRGIYAILTTLAGIGAIVLGGGMTVLAADLIHNRHGLPVLHAAASALGASAAVVLLPVMVLVSAVMGGDFLGALLSAAAVVALSAYSQYEIAIAQARGDVLRVSLTDIGGALFCLGAAVLAAVALTPTVTALMAAWAAGCFATAIVQMGWARSEGGVMVAPAWAVAAGIVRRSAGVALANGMSLLASRIDVLVVAAVISASAAGVYSIPVALAGSLLLLSRSLLTATYHPIMTAPPGDVGRQLSATLRHSVIVVLGGGVASVPVVALAAGSVFGDAYHEIWQPYAVLVPATACICVVEVLRHFVLTRLERQREFVILIMSMAVVNGVLAVVGAAVFGVLGAAASTTVTYAVAAFALAVFCGRTVSMPVGRLVLPRRTDLAAYRSVVGAMAARVRQQRSR